MIGFLLGAFFVLPFVLVYFTVVRWSDRFLPQPLWLVIGAFMWGAVFATLFGGASSAAVEKALIAKVGFAEDSEILQAVGATVLAPVFEEGFKGIGVLLVCAISAFVLKRFRGALSGAVLGGTVGLGFTLTEDTLYVGNQFAQAGFGGLVVLLFIRTVLLGLSHCTFTACTGLGLGIAKEAKRPLVKVIAPFAGFGAAMIMHAVHNALPTLFTSSGLLLMLLASWAIDLLFFLLLWILVSRDRSVVIRELLGEVGTLLHASELKMVTSYIALRYRDFSTLFANGWSAYRLRTKKQEALVLLAFAKARAKEGSGPSADSARQEAELRREITELNRQGAWLG